MIPLIVRALGFVGSKGKKIWNGYTANEKKRMIKVAESQSPARNMWNGVDKINKNYNNILKSSKRQLAINAVALEGMRRSSDREAT